MAKLACKIAKWALMCVQDTLARETAAAASEEPLDGAPAARCAVAVARVRVASDLPSWGVVWRWELLLACHLSRHPARTHRASPAGPRRPASEAHTERRHAFVGVVGQKKTRRTLFAHRVPVFVSQRRADRPSLAAAA